MQGGERKMGQREGKAQVRKARVWVLKLFSL
jgi:hypothetical protein